MPLHHRTGCDGSPRIKHAFIPPSPQVTPGRWWDSRPVGLALIRG